MHVLVRSVLIFVAVGSLSTRTRCEFCVVERVRCAHEGDCEETLAAMAIVVFVLCTCYATVPLLISKCIFARDVPSPSHIRPPRSTVNVLT